MKKAIAATILLAVAAVCARCDEPSRKLAVYESSMTVYGERLPLEEREVVLTPAQIVVITRSDIEEKGLGNFQELLETACGALGRDVTGNPAERTVDLRGFPDGTSVSVFLDGVRLNNIADNSVNLETIPVEMIERVEVYSGALAPLYGGGAIGGVVNIVTRKGEAIPRLDLSLGAGSHGAVEERLSLSGSKGGFSLFSTFGLKYAEGYRENDGYRLDDGALNARYDMEEKGALTLLVKYEGGATSAPGALTEEEMEEDREWSPYNLYDGGRNRNYLFSLGYTKKIGEQANLSAQLFRRVRYSDTLTTGRYLSGFRTSGKEELDGAVAEAGGTVSVPKGALEWSSSIEYQEGEADSRGWFTDFYGTDLFPASSTGVDEKLFGGYARGAYILPKFRFDLGYRRDAAEYDYSDLFNPSINTERSFGEGTARASVSCFPSDSSMLFAAFSEGYKIPTVIDLFAYPGFYSNPDLEPSRVNDYEIGYKFSGDRVRARAAFYEMFLRDETVFVLTDPAHFIGMNMNVGKSRRKGFEGEMEVNLPRGFTLEVNGTLRRAEVKDGPYEGSDIPMVPGKLAYLSISKYFGKLFVGVALRYVGPQYLDNDLDNTREKLGSYTVASLNASYRRGPFGVKVSMDNLFDREYCTRGVTNGYQDYFNPAYPLTARVVATWSF